MSDTMLAVVLDAWGTSPVLREVPVPENIKQLQQSVLARLKFF